MNDRKPASEYGQRKFEKGFAKKREGLQGVKNTLRKFWYDGSFARFLLMLPILFLLFLLNPATIMMIAATANDIEYPTEPLVQYGEFPFTLEYEVNGEKYICSDTIICEYMGDEWHTSFENRSDDKLMLDGTSNLGEYMDKRIDFVFFDIGSPEYHMGLSSKGKPQDFEKVNFIGMHVSGVGVTDFLSSETAYKKYGFRFISWECAPPIENSFE